MSQQENPAYIFYTVIIFSAQVNLYYISSRPKGLPFELPFLHTHVLCITISPTTVSKSFLSGDDFVIIITLADGEW